MLSDLFSKSAIVKILDFLIDEPDFDFSKVELAEKSELTWRSVNLVFPKLIRLGLLSPTRKVGKSQLYKLNTDNKIFKRLKKLDWEISTVVNYLEGMK